MCGITALFSKRKGLFLSSLKKMNEQIKHRGPDDEGYVLLPNWPLKAAIFGGASTPAQVFKAEIPHAPCSVIPQELNWNKYSAALGHNRLSILDLSEKGHQPMSTEDSRYWITYNGEVYNYIEIRKQLKAQGVSFFSDTDTEVVLKSYSQWGLKALDRFNGMFAFVIYDRKTNEIFAARDRFGIKPLYFWKSKTEECLAFGSEIKQFHTLPTPLNQINGQVAYDYLHWGLFDHNQHSFFKEIQQLRGGHFLHLSLDKLHQEPKSKPWYTLPKESYSKSFKSASTEFLSLFEDSIKLRLRSDVSVGSCLSGGLDSSSIVCLADQLLTNNGSKKIDQLTFSACSHEKRFDEKEFMDEVTRSTQTVPKYVYPRFEDLISQLPQIIWHQDIPFASTSVFAQWEIYHLVKQNNIKVMLDGQGADEQLGGYSLFFAPHFADLFKMLRWKTLFNEIKSSKSIHQLPSPLLSLFSQICPIAIKQPLRWLFNKQSTLSSSWINTKLLNAQKRDPFSKPTHEKSISHNISYAQIMDHNLPMLLHYEDRNSMAHSVEARTPFIDYRLVEFLLSLPNEYKIANGQTKKVLRDSMEGILPKKIQSRNSKLAFATPEEIWVRNEQPEKFRQLLRKAVEQSKGIISPQAIAMGDNIISGKQPFNFQLWRIICFGEWMEKFSVTT